MMRNFLRFFHMRKRVLALCVIASVPLSGCSSSGFAPGSTPSLPSASNSNIGQPQSKAAASEAANKAPVVVQTDLPTPTATFLPSPFAKHRNDDTGVVTPDVYCPEVQQNLAQAGCATMPPLSGRLHPAPVGTLVPQSPQVDLYHGSRTDSLGSPSLSLEVTQGGTAYLELVCVFEYAGYASTTTCPNTSISTWSVYGSSGIPTAAFTSTTTTGSTATEVYFPTLPNTPPGYYSFEVCINNNQSYGGTYCAPIVVEVDQTQPGPIEIPPYNYTLKLELGPVGLAGPFDVPYSGHLYFEMYLNGVPYTELDAGPVPGYNISNLNSTHYMYEQKFGETPLTDQAVDVTGYISPAKVLAEYNQYKSYQSSNDAPQYTPNIFNSNSWAVGALLAAGVPMTTITTLVTSLQADSARQAVGFDTGSVAEPCFSHINLFPPGILPFTESPAATVNPGGCTIQLLI